MMSGVITNHLCINSNPLYLNSRKESNFLCIYNNTHHPKSPTLIQNQVSSSKYTRFRTKATVNDQVMVTESEARMSFYELLDISESGSYSDIKHAYKQLARKYHPDVSPPERTEEYTKRFILVQEAYETLSDPSRRAMYDHDMARGLHLAFSARKAYDETGSVLSAYQGLERNEWKNHWQAQVAELKKKGVKKESSNKVSWGAQMRRKRFESDGKG